MGIVSVAPLAVRSDASGPEATITSTLRRTNSAARPGSRSSFPSAVPERPGDGQERGLAAPPHHEGGPCFSRDVLCGRLRTPGMGHRVDDAASGPLAFILAVLNIQNSCSLIIGNEYLNICGLLITYILAIHALSCP